MEPLLQNPILRNATYNSMLDVFMFLRYISTNTLLDNATYFSLLYFELALDTLLCYTVPKLEYALSRLPPLQGTLCKYRVLLNTGDVRISASIQGR